MRRELYAVIALIGFLLPSSVFAQAPVASFTASDTAGCSPVVVQFTDQSTGSPTSWHWDLGNGGSSTLQNPGATYINPGTYRVILTATNTNGSSKDTTFITVNASPTVAFSADSTPGCGSKTVSFTNSTTPGIGGAVSYLWDFGDGDSSTAASPTHTYSSVGTYSVSLVVTNSLGCTKTLTKNNYITVLSKPTAAFTGNTISRCNPPLNVTFNNSSTGATGYIWNFGDGNSSTATTPTHTYTSSGSYTVTLIATNTNGCTDTIVKSNYINVNSSVANFTFPSPVCAGTAMTFTKTSSPAGTSRTWNFGNGGSSVAANPTYTYNTPGTYNVRLIENYGSGCYDTVTKSVTISSTPTANFATNDTVGCTVPFAANFTNNSTGATSYAWNFGPGTSTATSPTYNYTSLGTYSVRLIATSSSGCRDTVLKPNYIKLIVPNATMSAAPTSTCTNTQVNFNVSLNGGLNATNYRWDFGDGSSIVNCTNCSSQSHSYTSTGTYNVQMVVTTATGCTDTVTRTITVVTKPTANFTGTPLTICPTDTVSFTNSSTGATSYLWSFGDGSSSTTTSPQHSFPSKGAYNIRLIAINSGCRDTLTRTGYVVVQDPEALFAVTNNCSNKLQFTFWDSSINANTYSWNFGDGNTSTTAGNVTHTYASPGTYGVSLTVYNTTTGCTHSITDSVYVVSQNLPDFTASDTTVCRNSIVVFTQDSAINGTKTWSFGNGQTTTTTDSFTSHNYTTPGTYTVKVHTTDVNGCQDSIVKNNYITVGGPVISYNISDNKSCRNETVLFQDNSVSTFYGIATRIWNFGDGNIDTTSSDTITHSYAGTGTYNIQLTIIDSNGCLATNIQNNVITVHQPTANFSTPDTLVCAGDTISFSNSSTSANGYTSLWSFGDGNTGTDNVPDHVYQNDGTYTVKLVITDTLGCMDSLTRTNYITVQKPTASFSMSDTVGDCPPLTVYFTNTTTNATSYAWAFGNNTQSTFTNPSTTYTSAGTYNVQLIASNAAGCMDTATNTVTVNGPSGSFTYSPISGCSPVTVQFNATATNTSSYIWDFNNGVTQTTTADSFTYTYTQGGQYLPKLILSDGVSCNVAIENTDTVSIDDMEADFSYTASGNFCNTDTIYFNDTVLVSYSNIVSRSWNFGDGNTDTVADPSHYYNTPGTYTVTLIMTNASGCIDTVSKNVVIHQLPNVNINTTADSICPNQIAQLTTTGAATYSWTPATGLSCTNCSNPTAGPSTTTTYIVTGTDTNSCSSNDTITVTLKPAPNISAGANKTICTGASTTLTASGTGTNTYVWSPSTGLSCTNCTSTNASPTATTAYTVIGTNTFGCTDTSTTMVTVVTKPTVSAGTDTSICLGDSVMLAGTGASTYSWTPSATLTCDTCDTTVAYPTTNTTYTLIGTLGNGCADTSTVTVTVDSLPTVSAGTDKSVCIGSSTTLQATGAATYTWTPSTGLGCTNCSNPTATPTTTTDYIVTGTDANGCANDDTVRVNVDPLPTVNAGNDTSICIGFSVNLQATGAHTYNWSPGTGLSCISCDNPTAAPAATTTYVVTGTDTNGCINTDTIIVTVNQQPTVSAATTQPICIGDTTSLLASGATTYIWSPSAMLSCNTCDSTLAYPATTTTYTVIGTDGNGCKDTTTIDVIVNTLPTVDAGNDTAICIGTSGTLIANGADSYIWSPSTGLGCTNCPNPTASPTTTTSYIVTGTDANGCVDTDTVTVDVNPLPAISAGTDKTICVGFNTSLTATGANTYTWSPAAGLSCTNCTSTTASPAVTTDYIVTGTDTNSCMNTDTVTVNVNQQPNVTTGSSKTTCNADTVQLVASGASSYIWSPGSTLTCTTCDTTKAFPSSTTVYTVVGTDVNGCKDTTTVSVNVNALPNIEAGNDTAICIGDSIQLQATGGISYIWSPSTGLSCTTCDNPVANPTVTTTYIVTGTDANGCTDTDTITITVNSLPSVSAGPDQTICIGFNTNLTASGANTYNWTPSGGLSCTNCTTPNASPNVTTDYIVTGTDANSCMNTDTVTVTVNQQPTVSAGTPQAICIGDTTSLVATGAVSYTWSPGSTLSCTNCDSTLAYPTNTTTYTVIGMDTNSCMDTNTVTVTVNTLPNVDAGNDTAICIGDIGSLMATGANTYTWTPSTGLGCTNCPNPTASPSVTSTYVVTGTDANGCVNVDTVTVTVNSLPNVSAGTDKTICIGFSTNLAATGANSYSWTPSAGLSCTNCNNPTASPTSTTNFIVTGTDNNSCVNTDTVIVNVNQQPNVSTGSSKTTCDADTVQLVATGASTYIWSPGSSLTCTSCDTTKAFPTVNTTYTVIGTDVNGCKDTNTVDVSVNALPTISAGPDTNICTGDNIQLQATGGSTYSWSPSTGLSCTNCSNPTANPTTTTTYIITGTDANGCSNKDTLTITVNSLPNVSAGTDKDICQNDSVQLQATGASTYNWSPATGLGCTNCATPNAAPTSNTNYIVTGTDANGCMNTDTVSVTVKSLPTVAITNDTAICQGTTAQLQASGAASYTWSPTSGLSCNNCSNPTANLSATTTFSVIGTASNGCTDTNTVTVTVNALPNINAGNDVDVCIGDSVQLQVTGADTYTWSPSTGLSCTNCATPKTSPVNTTTYTVLGIDTNGCSNTDSVTVTVKPLPIITLTKARDSICSGDTTQLNASGATSYAWSPASNLSCSNCPSPVANPTATTTYTVTGSNNGCSDTASITITTRPKPILTTGGNVEFCLGESDTLSVSGASNYQWSPSTGLSCTTCDSPIANPTTTTVYTVTGTDGSNCSNTANVTVTVNPLPVVDAGNGQSICAGDSVQLEATGASTYQWSPATNMSCVNCPQPKALITADIKYIVTGTDVNGCVNTDSVSILVISKDSTNVSNDDSICIGESTILTAGGGTTYLWSPSNGLSNQNGSTTEAAPETTTLYTVYITQGDCFTDTATVKVTVQPLPNIDAGEDKTVTGGTRVTLEPISDRAVTYSWIPAQDLSCNTCQYPEFEALKTTTYYVTVTSEYGCEATDSVTIFVTCGEDQIFVPNTFTPNNDGLNDRFYPSGKGAVIIKRFSVYNRWGELLYDVTDIPVNNPMYGWDGTYKNEQLKPDVFVYILRAECEDGQPIELKGDISLIR